MLKKPRKKRSPIWATSDEYFIDLVKNSSSMSEILRSFGMENKGGNYKTVRARCESLDLDISSFPRGLNSNLGRKFPNAPKISLENLLVENSSHNRFSLKKRIIDESLIEYVCQDCGLKDKWNNKKLVLRLDHINGVSNDNRIDNLRFLCPNCDSQTETFAGKNKRQ